MPWTRAARDCYLRARTTGAEWLEIAHPAPAARPGLEAVAFYGAGGV
jgi:hypothetical protein